MKIAAIIPARFASSRLPGKPLLDLGGKPMIQRVYEQTQQATALAHILVATDDVRIFDVVKKFGGEVAMTASTHQNGTERVAEATAYLPTDIEVVLNIQGDEPFIQPAQIDLLASMFTNEEVKIGTLIKPIADRALLEKSSVVKVVTDTSLRALYFSRSAIPFVRYESETPPTTFYKHIGLYGFQIDTLHELVKLPIGKLEAVESLEQLRWLENGYRIHTAITHLESIAIDTPDDVAHIRTMGILR